MYCGERGLKRTDRQHETDAENATFQNRPIRGVKGISPLMMIPLFSVLVSLPPDYLHNIAIGVNKYLFSMFFYSKFSSKEWYMEGGFETINRRFLNIQLPSEVTRTPQSITDRNQWKASEWRNMFLYYCIPCFKDILPKKYLDHLFLLIYSVTIFLQTKISEHQFESARSARLKFFTGENA